MAKGLEGMYKRIPESDIEKIRYMERNAETLTYGNGSGIDNDYEIDEEMLKIRIAVEEEEALERKKEEERQAKIKAAEEAYKAEREAWKASFSGMSIEELDSAYDSLTMVEKEEERAKLEAELMAVHGESEELKAKIAILDKRLEIAREQEQRAREVVMELEGIF